MLGPLVQTDDTPANALLVLAKRDSTLLIVDPSSLHVIARIPVGNDPHEVIASTDGKTAYVSNYGFGAYNTLLWAGKRGSPPKPPRPLAVMIPLHNASTGSWALAKTERT